MTHQISRRSALAALATSVGAVATSSCAGAAGSGGAVGGGGAGASTLSGLGYAPMPQSIIDAFAEQTGVTVNWDYVDTATFPQVLQSRVSARADIDLVNCRGGAEFNRYARADSFAPLTDAEFLSNVDEGGLASGEYDGTQYGYSSSSYVIGLHYNTDVFASAGVSAPQTWEEFEAVCAALQESGVSPLVGSQVDGWTNQYYYHAALARWAAENPTFMTDLQTGSVRWQDHTLFVTQVQRFAGLVERGYFLDGTQSFRYADALGAFNSGTAAMWAMGNWSLSQVEPQGFEPGAFAVPFADPGPSPASSLSDTMFAVTSWSGKQDLATQFLAFLTQQEQAETYAVESEQASAIKGVEVSISPYQGDWDAMRPDAVPFPMNLGPAVNDSGPGLLGNLFAGASAEDVIEEFQGLQEEDNALGY